MTVTPTEAPVIGAINRGGMGVRGHSQRRLARSVSITYQARCICEWWGPPQRTQAAASADYSRHLADMRSRASHMVSSTPTMDELIESIPENLKEHPEVRSIRAQHGLWHPHPESRMGVRHRQRLAALLAGARDGQ